MKLTLEPALQRRLEKYLEASSFNDLSQLIVFILGDFLDQDENNSGPEQHGTDNLNQRLKDLGYF